MREHWRERFFRCFRWFSTQPGCLWSFIRRSPKVIPVNLELATPGLAATGSPPRAVPVALISIWGKWDLRGGSPSGQEQVGGHMVTWGSYHDHT